MHSMNPREDIIKNYIEGYNNFDVEKMVRDMDNELLFENISNGMVTDSLSGKEDFMHQAEQAKDFFSQRTQTITAINHHDTFSEVFIDYEAIMAMDISDSLKFGDKIKLKGKSIFEFNSEGKISLIKDIS